MDDGVDMSPPETERRDQVTHGGVSCSRLPFGVKASIAQGAAGSKVRFIARPPAPHLRSGVVGHVCVSVVGGAHVVACSSGLSFSTSSGGATGTTFRDVMLERDQRYYYVVQAYDTGGVRSVYSVEANGLLPLFRVYLPLMLRP
jgi:hypothetical protein